MKTSVQKATFGYLKNRAGRDYLEILENHGITALNKTGAVLRDSAQSRIAQNTGGPTESRKLQSAEQRAESASRDALIDSLEFTVFVEDDGTMVLLVRVKPESGDVARFMEFERMQVFWGHESGEMSDPEPFMRPAYEENKQVAIDTMAVELRKALR